MSISAHEATRSSDCATHGCPLEAESGHAHCRDHRHHHNERRRPMSTVAATTSCKIDGCEEQASPKYTTGWAKGLCEEHCVVRGREIAANARASRSGSIPTGAGVRPKTSTADGYAAKVRALVPAARSLDQAQRKLETIGTSEGLKAEFDEALRRANGVPSTENLDRLLNATKALQRGAPARERLVAQYQEAERKFKLALAAIARDLR